MLSTRSITAALTLLVGALPALWLAGTVARYGVEIPALDDWEMAPLIAKAHTGELTLADLFAQQEEARTFVPKLVFVLSALDGHWDVRDQMWLSVALCIFTAGGIYILLRRSGLGVIATALCFWSAVLLIFSPAQFELWLLASGFPSFVPVLCIVGALLVLETRWSIGVKFAGCAALCAVSTFTLAHGLLAWGLTFPVYLVSRREPLVKRWTIAWLGTSAAFVALYFVGYKKPAHLPEFAPALPALDYAQFFFAFIGGAFAYASKDQTLAVATAIGAVVVILCLGVAAFAFGRRGDRDWMRRALPWFALGGYSLASGVLVTFGRIGFGLQYAVSSRYVTFSLYATVAVIALGALILPEVVRSRRSLFNRAAVIALCLALGVAGIELYRACFARTLGFLYSMSARNRMARTALLFSPVIDSSAVIKRYNYRRPEVAANRIALLDQLGLIRSALVRTKAVESLAHAAADERAAAGVFETLSMSNGAQWRASGWAALKVKGRAPDAILFAYETPERTWNAFAISDSVVKRRDIARLLKDEAHVWAGWSATFPRDAVPPGARISAWAVDADVPKLYRLKQNAVVATPSSHEVSAAPSPP